MQALFEGVASRSVFERGETVNALVLGGPAHKVMAGWEHFQIIIRHGGGLKVSTCISQSGHGLKMAEQLRGKFFPVGTWENGIEPEAKNIRQLCFKTAKLAESYDSARFPSPRPEILDELFKQGGAS